TPVAAGVAAGSTHASSAPLTPAAAFGPDTPAKNTANVTGTVTIAASAVVELTAVAMAISALPPTASSACAASLSRHDPANVTTTSVAKPPKAANVAACRLPRTWSAKANRAGTTRTARSARTAEGGDHVGRHEATVEVQRGRPGAAVDATAPSDTSRV